VSYQAITSFVRSSRLSRTSCGVFAGGGGATPCDHRGRGRLADRARALRDVLTAAESKKYEDLALQELTLDCAHWLATGEMPRG
jgi:hypothetical protein